MYFIIFWKLDVQDQVSDKFSFPLSVLGLQERFTSGILCPLMVFPPCVHVVGGRE